MALDDTVDAGLSGTPKDHDDVDVGSEPVVILAANPHRKSALLINIGGQPVRITTDGSDPGPIHGKLLAAGAALSMSYPFCPLGEVKAYCEAADGSSINPSEVS